MVKEFKEFIMKGNVLDLAVAVIIGGAFGKIVSSFVADVIMPPLGLLMGGVDFSDLAIVLKEAVLENGEEVAAAVAIRYGAFVQTIIDFLIIGFAIFMVVKGYNSTKKKEEAAPAAPPEPTNEEKLLAEIRDLLRK